MSRPGRMFRSVNPALAESLARDFGIRLHSKTTSEVRFGVNAPVVAEQKFTRAKVGLSPTDPEVLDRIVRKLRKSGQLRSERPERPETYWRDELGGWYVEERLRATPVTLSKINSKTGAESRKVDLTVWVCWPLQPLPKPTDPWDATGSFVFLVEELGFFEWPAGSQISGISSLRLAVEVVASDMTWEEIRALPPIADRFSEQVTTDPISKLKSIGGIVGVPRPITTVYKIAYMNDEQGWNFDGSFLRVNDILAYPLYIISE